MSGFIEAVLNVLTIVALISVTSFIIIFLVDLLLSISNRNGAIFFRAKEKEVKPTVEKQETVEENVRPKVLEKQAEQTEVVEQSWDEEAAKQEQRAIESKQSTKNLEEQELQEAKQKDLQNMHIQDEKRQQLIDDFDDFDELFAEDAKEAKTQEPELKFDDIIDEINKECVTKYEASKKVEIVEPVKEELEAVATKENEDFGIKFDQDDLEDFETLFGIQESKTEEKVVEAKAEAKTEAPTTVVTPAKAEIVNVYEYFPQDALQERLAKLQERLKINERDLKANKKEYNPLAKVNRSLKRDQEKLRRREAVVARKKVMLYGVNNYVDIDEEKAKKLSEELDLLDGLRLSVQHCEEVMEQNKDRFPILEKTNAILTEQNKQIKEDIAEVKAAIDKLNEDK